MRNIFIFPDGSTLPFMYPENREVEPGTTFTLDTKDGNVLVVVTKVEQVEKTIYYYLEPTN